MQAVLIALFFLNLLVLVIYDFKYKAVPDYLLLVALFLSFFISEYSFIDSLKNAFFISGAFVLLNFIVTFYIQNIKSRFLKDESLKTKTALGEGDIPLIASFAIIVGLEEVIFLVFLSALLAIVLYIYRVKRFKDGEIPFIPPLAVAFLLEYFLNLSIFFKGLFWD